MRIALISKWGVNYQMLLLGRLIAWVLVVLGGLRVAMGLYVANAFVSQDAWEAANRRYLGSATSGEAINQGLIWIAVGVAFGLLTLIASNTLERDGSHKTDKGL